MTQSLSVLWHSTPQAGQSLNGQVVPWCKERMAEGKQVIASFEVAEDTRSLQQLRFYWGPMLGDISEQATIGGQKYSKDAWHELFKRQHLPRRIRKSKVAGRGRPVVSVSLGSTKGLSVRRMSEFIEKVQAFAVTDLGVTFSETRWESYEHR